MQVELSGKNTQYPFLQGGGEMGVLTRRFDWAATSIGPPQQWPQSLRTIVSTILCSRYPMFLWWGNDLIQFYNDAYRPSFGNTGKHPAALGQRGEDCWPEIWPTIKPLIDQVLAGEATWSEDQLIPIYRNGELEDVYWTFGYSPIKNDAGSVQGVLVICNETTEKVNNYKKLANSEKELGFAIEAAKLGTWDLDPITQRFSGNDRLKRWFGLEPHDPIQLGLATDIIAIKDRQRVIDAINYAQAYRSGGDYDIEYTITRPQTGEEKIVRAIGKAIFDENRVVQRFSGILLDMTERKAIENRIDHTSVRLELALDAGKLGSYEYDIGSGIIDCTAQCKLNFGLSENDILTFNGLVSMIVPSDRQGMIANVQEALLRRTVYKTEYRVKWPDESIHWIRMYGKALYDELEQPLKMIGITVDATEERSFYHELEKLVQERTVQLENKNKELERSNASLEEFTHIASHDLKEPMRKVHFFTDRLKSQLADRMTEEERLTFGRIENANNRMVALIEDLLLYSRFSQRPPVMENVDLNEQITKVLEDLEVDIHQKKATITVQPLPTVKGYQGQLQQLFQNLIGNALKYQQEELPPAIHIFSSVVRVEEGHNLFPGKYFLIEVEDNGIGFEQDHSERIFQMFQRLHGNAEYKGTGVGLAIARKVTDNHLGRITAESVPGKGSRFKVYLPVP